MSYGIKPSGLVMVVSCVSAADWTEALIEVVGDQKFISIINSKGQRTDSKLVSFVFVYKSRALNKL